jgi:hypothetical protein
MTITGYLYDGESKESVEDRIDLLQEIIERQRIRSEIPELEAKREQMVKGMMQAREVLTELEDKQKARRAAFLAGAHEHQEHARQHRQGQRRNRQRHRRDRRGKAHGRKAGGRRMTRADLCSDRHRRVPDRQVSRNDRPRRSAA